MATLYVWATGQFRRKAQSANPFAKTDGYQFAKTDGYLF